MNIQSYTNLILLVTIAVALVTQSWPSVAIALGAMISHAHMRHELRKTAKANAQDERISNLEQAFRSVEARICDVMETNQEIKEQAKEVKRIVQQHNLKQMFGPKV